MAWISGLREGDGIAIGDKVVIVVGLTRNRKTRLHIQTPEDVKRANDCSVPVKLRIARVAKKALAEIEDARKRKVVAK